MKCCLTFSLLICVLADAYKQADGRKVDNRRVLVDVERGRTVPNWRPRRLGGGLGSSRIGGENAEQKLSTRYIYYFSILLYEGSKYFCMI
jgi:hypothetical protein